MRTTTTELLMVSEKQIDREEPSVTRRTIVLSMTYTVKLAFFLLT